MSFKKNLVFILPALFFSASLFSQKITVRVFFEKKTNNPSSDTIYYDFNKSLTWQDFQGKVPPGARWGAMTSSGFSFNSKMEDDGNNHIIITVGVFVFFTKHDSWKKPEIHSAYHLEHEQHHFDITRLYARKLTDEIKEAHFTKTNYRKLLNSVFDKVYAESIALQHEYDSQTKNSMDVEKQNEWNEKISDEIKKLKDISNSF